MAPTRILVVDDSPTIRKVVGSILERHGFEPIFAADGQIALEMIESSAANADVVLLDFVMPRMNGFQFCRALRSKPEHRGMPVVLMSAKSDKIREQFVRQTGAIDAITKPFDAQALVAVIENAISRAEAWRAREDSPGLGMASDFDPSDAPGSSPSSVGPVSLGADSRRTRSAYELARKFAATLAPVVAKLSASASGNEAQIVGELATLLASDGVRELSESIRALEFSGAKPALVGDIAVVPIGAILQLLQIENQTGTLSVSNGKSDVSIAMRRGLIDMVQSRGAGQEFRLGRYFVEHGLVTPVEIDALLREPAASGEYRQVSGEHRAVPRRRISTPPPPREAHTHGDRGSHSALFPRQDAGWEDSRVTREPRETREETTGMRKVRLLGDLLLESGRITAEQLRDALARQSSELIYEVLRWGNGRFEFRHEAPPPLADSAKLGLPVASVVMEGFRRVDEWRLVEAGLGSFDSVLIRDPVAIDALGTGRLARAERTVLECVDGERTVREIISASNMSSFDTCKVLFQLLEARLVRRRAT